MLATVIIVLISRPMCNLFTGAWVQVPALYPKKESGLESRPFPKVTADAEIQTMSA